MVKKARCLSLLLALLLLLCACSQQVTEQSETIPFGNAPKAPPCALIAPAVRKISSNTAVASVAPIMLSTHWQTDRQIVPFEDRFKEDIRFSATSSWLVQEDAGTYIQYRIVKQKSDFPLAVMQEETVIYEIACDRDLTNFTLLSADSHWACLKDENEVIRVDLKSGEATTLLIRGENTTIWNVYAGGKDSLCILSVDSERNLKIWYRDIHSDAEKTVYTGIFPEIPDVDLYYFKPASTLSPICWRSMNPEFYAIAQKELADPDSPFKWNPSAQYSHPFSLRYGYELCCEIQKAHPNVPAQVEWSCDPITGELTAQYGHAATCARDGSECCHNHYDTMDTWQTPLIVLDPNPIPVPNLVPELPEDVAQSNSNTSKSVRLYGYRFNDQYIYVEQDGKYTLLLPVPCKNYAVGNGYIYALTQDNSIVQLSWDGSICNTIYTAEDSNVNLMYHEGSIYLLEGDQVIRINTVKGTSSPILRCAGRISIDNYGHGDVDFFIMIRQGIYVEHYFFNPDTLETFITWEL